MIRIGTSGWSYPTGPGTWNGVFYPKPRPRGFDELAFYAEHFSTVEVNTTFYGVPRVETAQSWVDRTPAGFEFSVKLYQKFTHPKMFKARELERAPGATGSLLDWLTTVTRSDVDEFKRAIEPLADAGKLGALLAQFPPSFKATADTRAYLESLLRTFAGYELAVELRHRSWSDEIAETIGLLNEHRAAFVQIDEPKFSTSIRQNLLPTIASYYLRLHGRNAAQWWSGDRDSRYNYLYSDTELQPFADTLTAVEAIGVKARAHTNNHPNARAVANAKTLQAMVGQLPAGHLPEEMLVRYPHLAR